MKPVPQSAFLLVLFFSLVARADGPGDPKPAPTADLTAARKLISQLDSDDFQIRTAAGLKLNNLPGDALPAVEAALKSGAFTAESQLRLQTALKILKPRHLDDQRQAEHETWELAALQNAYKQCGKTSRLYDHSINEALEIFRDLPYEPQMNDRNPKRLQALTWLKAAIGAGCDDPMIQSLYVITAGNTQTSRLPPPMNRPDPIFAAFLDQNHPAAFKLMMIQRYMPCSHFLVRGKLENMLAPLVAQMCADKTVPQWEIYIIMSKLTSAYHSHGGGMDRLAPAIAQYEKSAPNLSESAIIKGFFQYLTAFELRGGGHASPDQQKAFEAKLAEAEKTLTAGWEADPGDNRCAAEIISVKRALGDATDRQSMELWFKRVIDVDPNNTFAYECKLNYLIENASHEETVAFGHECLNTQNWRVGLPFLLAQIHNRYALDHPDYFSNAANWKDMEDVYEGYFVNFPDDSEHRNEFVVIALQANKFDVAAKQNKILGKKSKWSFIPASRPASTSPSVPRKSPAQN